MAQSLLAFMLVWLSSALRSSTIPLAENGYRLASPRRRDEGDDLHVLALSPAVRFYCEYKTRERIHRGLLTRDY